MKTYELPFGIINILQDDIAEVIIHDEVELNVEMVDELHEVLLSHLTEPFSLLVNKVNSYTYDFQAQLKLTNLEEVNAVAAVVYSNITKVSTETMIKLKKHEKPYIRTFENREEAFQWLLEIQEFN